MKRDSRVVDMTTRRRYPPSHCQNCDCDWFYLTDEGLPTTHRPPHGLLNLTRDGTCVQSFTGTLRCAKCDEVAIPYPGPEPDDDRCAE